MREHRRVLVLILAVVAAGALTAAGGWLAFSPSLGGRRASAAAGAPAARGSASSSGAEEAVGADPAIGADGAPVAFFPDVMLHEPPIRPGIGSVLAGRRVRAGERLPASHFTSWIREEQALPSSSGAEVVLLLAGSGEPPPAPKTAKPASRIPAEPIHSPIRSWLVAATAQGRTSVLTLHESAPAFARDDWDCTDETTIPTFREVRTQPSTLWIEVQERWFCRPAGAVPAEEDEEIDDGSYAVEQRLGFVVVADRDGALWRLAAAVPLKGMGLDGTVGALSATFGQGNSLVLRAGTPPPTEEQDAWIGAFALEPLLQQARAAPTWVDEPVPGGPVSATCAPSAGVPRLLIEPDPPITRRPWSLDPEVTVLSVPRTAGRVRLRAFTVDAKGARAEVSDDPCLRFQLVGAGLRPMPVRNLFEVVGGADRVETASVLALYRGQRAVLRFEEAPPVAPELPPAAAEALSGALPGLRLPEPALCPGWDLFATGPGLVFGDIDRDGRDDVAALLLDEQRWELAVLTQTPRGDLHLAFHAGAPRAKTAPGDPPEELSLRRTLMGDLSLRRTQGARGEEWIVHATGKQLERTVLPLLRPGPAFTADRFGIAPRGVHLDERTATREALVASLSAGEAETFATLPGMAAARRATVAGWVVDAIGTATGDRTRLLAALALLGRPAADVATPALGALVFSGTPWRGDLEATAAECALGQMGEPGLQLLALHPREAGGVLAAADIIAAEPQLRSIYQDAMRDRPRSLAVALAAAPIVSPGELVDALAMIREDRDHVLARLQRLARQAPRSAETDALLSAAVPALVEQLTQVPPEEVAAVASILGDIGPLAAPAVSTLEPTLSSPDCRRRVAARRALAAIRGRPLTITDSERDLTIECGGSSPLPPRPAAQGAPTRPASLPADGFIVRNLERLGERGYGFRAPEVDWKQLAQGRVEGVDVDSGRGPKVEQARLRASRNTYEEQCLRFQSSLPAPLQKAHYYGVTISGVEPLDPRKLLGDVCVGSSGISTYRGHVAAETSGDGFVIVSGPALVVSDVSRQTLDQLWPQVAAACGIDPSSEPRGIAFRMGRGGQSRQYAYAILPAGEMCSDRRRLLRIEGNAAEVVEATDAGCDL